MATASSSSSTSPRSNARASLQTNSTSTVAPNARQRAPRSLPPWIDSYHIAHGSPLAEALSLIDQSPPPPAQAPQHNSTPSLPQRQIRRVSKDGFIDWEDNNTAAAEQARRGWTLGEILRRRGGAERGRKWDHLRSADPVVVSGHIASSQYASPWRTFVHSSAYGFPPGLAHHVVRPEEFEKMQPGYNLPVEIPWQPSQRTRTRAAALYKRIWYIILQHPLIPLASRLTVLLTSTVALALSVRILELQAAEGGGDSTERTQAIVAIIVDTVAIPYIGYMTWDEYTGKPLGLRPATQKSSLILMDLFFIIFKSASTTLAFEALMYHESTEPIKPYSRALAAFQTVSLISWTLTFTVNVFRLVQRLGGGEDEGQRSHWAGHG